jgi:HEAT repeat protein
MSKKSVAVVLALIIFVGIFDILRANVQRGEMEKLLDQLRSENIDERDAAAHALVARKQQVLSNPSVIAGIEEIVKEYTQREDRRGAAKTAITLLGELQSERSIPLLVEHLTFGVFYKETKRAQSPEDYYPAVGALVQIGKPALEPVLAKAERTDDATVLRCAALVVKDVLRTDAARFIREHAAQQSNPQVRQRLSVMETYAQN